MRLPFFLGHTTHIHYTPDNDFQDDTIEFLRRLAAFHAIHVTMRTLDPLATLWPSLLKVQIDYPNLPVEGRSHAAFGLAALIKMHGVLYHA
jgi:hypothetical protein